MALVLFTAAAFLGNVAGYEIGRAIGATPVRAGRAGPEAEVLRPEASAFFDKHGNKALVIGRFVPFVRTYITVVAGVTRMERARFFVWSAGRCGAVGPEHHAGSATSSAPRSRAWGRTSTRRSW